MTNDPQNPSENDPYPDPRAQSWWPPPPPPTTTSVPARDHRPAGTPWPPAPSPGAPPPPGTRRSGGAWRSVGVAALGLVGGFLLAIVLQDVIGTAFIRGADGDISVGVALLIAALVPVLSAAGVVVALLIDRAARRRDRDR